MTENNRLLLVLRALLLGIPCKIGQHTWQVDADTNLCSIGYSDTRGEVLLLFSKGLQVRAVQTIMEQMTEEQYMVIASNLMLNTL